MLAIRGFSPATNRRCVVCGQPTYGRYRILEGVGTVCSLCLETKAPSASNVCMAGRGGLSFSLEFETGSTAREQYVLLRRHYVPTFDSSIGGIEWKSPIYKSRRPFRWDCEHVLDRLAHLVDGTCGTHLHVGVSQAALQYAYDWQRELFRPLLNEMVSHRDDTELFWGRFFNDFARPVFYGDHYQWINPWARHDTMEFRVLRFRGWRQYYVAASFCIAVALVIEKAARTCALPCATGDRILRGYRQALSRGLRYVSSDDCCRARVA